MAYKNKADQAAAAKRHYEANKEKLNARAKEHTKRTRAAIYEHISTYLDEHPCVDCGESDKIVLEFDHRDSKAKLFAIASGVQRGFSLNNVKAEIEKCDVRCANCHRRKTYKERGYKHKG